jgi:hypothetical protein
MPRLIRLYILQSLLGVAVATAFVAGLFAFNVGNLWYLVTHTAAGPLAAFLLWAHFAVLFAGVQFAIRVMRMGEEEETEDGPRGGTPVRLRVAESSVPRAGRRGLSGTGAR